MYTQSSQLNAIQHSGKFLLDRVAFFGRTLSEYTEMFHFEPENYRGKRVLDCASGPASFAAEANIIGVEVTACDPMYEKTVDELFPIAAHDIRLCLENKDAEINLFDRRLADEARQYAAERNKAAVNFKNDFARGKEEGRYIAGSLPNLPFPDEYFNIALCSNLLFLYASKEYGGILDDNRFPIEFHIDAIYELLRVVREEIRIYPIKGMNSADSPMADGVIAYLRNVGYRCELVPVKFREVAGADKMLRIYKERSARRF